MEIQGGTAIEAEMSILGAMMLDPWLIDPVRARLGPNSFHEPRHQVIFETLVGMVDAGKLVDQVTLKAELEARGALALVGGMEYCESLVIQLPTSGHAPEYATIIETASKVRRVQRAIAAFSSATAEARRNGVGAELQTSLAALRDEPQAEAKPVWYGNKALESEAIAAGAIEIVPLVFPGFRPNLGHAAGRVSTLGGYSGDYKTTSLVAEHVHLASLGHPCLAFSLEVSRTEWWRRVVAACQGETIPEIYVLDTVRQLKELVAVATAFAEKYDGGKAPVVLIDFLGRIKTEAPSREREVGLAAEAMSDFARGTGCIVVQGAQINREGKKEGAPQLFHLRDSGSVEQASDLVLILNKTDEGRVSVECCKNRWGAGVGESVELVVDAGRCAFTAVSAEERAKSLALEVVPFLRERSGKAKVTDVCKGTRIPGSRKRPKRSDIESAGLASKAFVIDGFEVRLI
jgi:replicative DNA helicase